MLHSAIVFIEENLPAYFEGKNKKKPLNEHYTPKFLSNESMLLSPKSQGQSCVLSKLG